MTFTQKMALPAVLLAASASGVGKTTTALGLIGALRNLGFSVLAAKTGPDFIDAAWLARATGHPVANLDLWMATGHHKLFARIGELANSLSNPFLVIEGAMGFHDGDRRGRGSTAEIAARLGIPYLMLLDAARRGQTIAALAQGLLDYRPSWSRKFPMPGCCGVICSGVSGKSHASLLEKALRPVLKKRNIDFLGSLAQTPAMRIPSRHLGLAQSCEHQFDLDAFADWFCHNINPHKILHRLGIMPSCSPPAVSPGRQFFSGRRGGKKTAPRIAIARDEAFAFCYADLPALLEDLGAGIEWFSPLRSDRLPDCDGIYIPGGYPELHLKALSENLSLLAGIRAFAEKGGMIYGECGGYIYLGQSCSDLDGVQWAMAGLLPLQFKMRKCLAALGYRRARSVSWPDIGEVRGHEFHYAQASGSAINPMWHSRDSLGGMMPDGCVAGNVAGAWLHLYPDGSRKFWQWWLKQCAEKKL